MNRNIPYPMINALRQAAAPVRLHHLRRHYEDPEACQEDIQLLESRGLVQVRGQRIEWRGS